jgi:hypothetical protein
MKDDLDGSPHSTGQGHGSADERKKKRFLQSERGVGIPMKRMPELSLDRKKYPPFC